MKVPELLLPLCKELNAVHEAVSGFAKKTEEIGYAGLVERDVLEFNLRPALVFWSARLCGSSPAGVIPVATAIQLIFLAEVIHRKAAMEEVQGSELKNLVLVGDYFFSGSFRVLADAGLQRLLAPLARVVCAECEAAVEYQKTAEPTAELVKRETALLIGECCRLPAMLAGAAFEEEMHGFGINLGIAYGLAQRKAPLAEIESYVEAALKMLLKLPGIPTRQQLKKLLDLIVRDGSGVEVAATR